ncbi:MAG: helix-turn-helix transcriptional regulator [Syntrophomonadaceae bacterium]|nr:helix-turn-helix transcriptional regulator [Syntrophomonadaceae bacterium]
MNRVSLVTVAGGSSYTVNKLSRSDNVTTDILQKICKSLECDIGDIMEILPDKPEPKDSKSASRRATKR